VWMSGAPSPLAWWHPRFSEDHRDQRNVDLDYRHTARYFDRQGHHATAHRHRKFQRWDNRESYESGELDLGQ
jgi:hypothetical protein